MEKTARLSSTRRRGGRGGLQETVHAKDQGDPAAQDTRPGSRGAPSPVPSASRTRPSREVFARLRWPASPGRCPEGIDRPRARGAPLPRALPAGSRPARARLGQGARGAAHPQARHPAAGLERVPRALIPTATATPGSVSATAPGGAASTSSCASITRPARSSSSTGPATPCPTSIASTGEVRQAPSLPRRARLLELHLRPRLRERAHGELPRRPRRRLRALRRRARASRARQPEDRREAARPLRGRDRGALRRARRPLRMRGAAGARPASRATRPRSRSACRSPSARSWRPCATAPSSASPRPTPRSPSGSRP